MYYIYLIHITEDSFMCCCLVCLFWLQSVTRLAVKLLICSPLCSKEFRFFKYFGFGIFGLWMLILFTQKTNVQTCSLSLFVNDNVLSLARTRGKMIQNLALLSQICYSLSRAGPLAQTPLLPSGGLIGRHLQETLLPTLYAQLLPEKNLLEGP